MARFRLRFLLQELDLTGPTLTLGRSSDCQITLDDPLVSRMHAELTVTDSYVRVRDLGSRNGVRINDQLIDGEAELRHNDRLRLGSQDLLFLVVGPREQRRTHNATGSLVRCPECDRPMSSLAKACPRCGALMGYGAQGPDTITGVELAEPPSWTFRLLAEVLERALAAGRAPEARRMLERAARDLDTRGQGGGRLGADQVRDAAGYALRLAKLEAHPEWASWAIELHRRARRVPDAQTLALLEELDVESLRAVGPQLAALLSDPQLASQSGDTSFAQRLERLLNRAV